MHECGTRLFLRWVQSQGLSTNASGKVKNTFDPISISLFGATLAPGNKPNPSKEGKSLGGWRPEAGGTLQCQGTPGRTAQRYDGLPNAAQQLERKDPSGDQSYVVALTISILFLLRLRCNLAVTIL